MFLRTFARKNTETRHSIPYASFRNHIVNHNGSHEDFHSVSTLHLTATA